MSVLTDLDDLITASYPHVGCSTPAEIPRYKIHRVTTNAFVEIVRLQNELHALHLREIRELGT